ncbi:protein of unknown function [Streptomyces sp. KY75]|nr:protein of unknown function [Streptomyces sp. KY75]CAD5977463.1 protein of unknown function [Streptomyces sp. KY70]
MFLISRAARFLRPPPWPDPYRSVPLLTAPYRSCGPEPMRTPRSRRPLTSCDDPGTPCGCVLFTRGSCRRRPGVAASPHDRAVRRVRRARAVRQGRGVRHGERRSSLRRHGLRAVRRRAPHLDRGARRAPRAGAARCEPRRLHRTHDTFRRSFPRPRRVVLHAGLIPAPAGAPPGSRGRRAITATTPEKPQARASHGADPTVRAAGMAEVGLPFEWPLRAFAV